MSNTTTVDTAADASDADGIDWQAVLDAKPAKDEKGKPIWGERPLLRMMAREGLRLTARCAALADKLDTALDYIGLEDSQIAVSPSELMAFIDAACALLQPAQEEAEDAQ